jgi:1,4-dihydroxy-2-naphthoate polyprenyltransferase
VTAPAPRDRWRIWLAASRPKTLAASVVPVLVGTAFAQHDGRLQPWAAAAALAGAVLIQVGTNLANDYHDHVRGADTPDRVGPARASASGWIAPKRVLAASLVAFALAAAAGLYLVALAGWPILVVGLLSIASGYAYTGGPYPLGYHGWGDAFVFVFFGLVAVAGTYFVQAGPASADVLVGAVPVGALATAILVVNNLRDLETDRRAGKRTLAVRLGPTGTRVEYAFLLAVAAAAPFLLLAMGHAPLVLLPLVAAPWGAWLLRSVWRQRDPRALNPLLAATAQYLALVGLLLSAGVALG